MFPVRFLAEDVIREVFRVFDKVIGDVSVLKRAVVLFEVNHFKGV